MFIEQALQVRIIKSLYNIAEFSYKIHVKLILTISSHQVIYIRLLHDLLYSILKCILILLYFAREINIVI